MQLEQELDIQPLMNSKTDCFLPFQLIRDEPRKKQKPVVDLLVSGHAPQSESEKPLRISDDDELKNKSWPGLFFRNLRT
jgi:hypothetical protein